MSNNTYVVLPRADIDLDDLALYYAANGGADVGDHFLTSAYETFAPLATPNMGWRP